jgi:phosphatidylserine/phosphatidylglycerophosphate/cardiolipin synthase-like enzyme
MSPFLKIILFVIGLFLAGYAGYSFARTSFESRFTVLYSLDKKENDRAIVGAINDAKTYVYFAIYTFTKNNIEDALIKAKKRGLDVEGIMDAGQSADAGPQQKIVDKLRSVGISVEMQKHVKGIMHIKMLVTDSAYALGSYNWTESATEFNDEVLEIGTDDGLRERYLSIIKEVLLANQ